MKPQTLYVAITHHGFGHATRAASIAATVKRQRPHVNVCFATKAPRWLLESYFEYPFTLREVALDIGVVQPDSLTMDRAATLDALQAIRNNQEQLVTREAAFLRKQGVDLVLGDIPPLIAIAAQTAGIPCWMMSNFGWDFIYRPWGGEYVAMANWIAECFGHCDRLFRLPFHEPMSAFIHTTDVGLTGGNPRHTVTALQEKFQLTVPKDKTVLLTFGGLGLTQIPYEELQRFPDWQFITFDQTAPDLMNLCRVSDRTLRPVDFMPLCGRVVSKPGYSTFAEACRFDIPITTVTRDDFAEGPILIENLRARYPHQVLSPQDFVDSGWSFLYQDPQPPGKRPPYRKTGNQDIATAISTYLDALL